MNKRFEGSRVLYPNHAEPDMLPKSNMKMSGDGMDESEVVTRMLFVLNNFKIWDLKALDWQKGFED